jgi:AraC family transcriptional regulator
MKQLGYLAEALEYIENNICEDITAEDVANACYYSKSGLQKIFKYVYDCSIKEYVIHRRITKAARDLVIHPGENVLDIALRYCYSSHEAFTRAFEQVWHCKPSVFRRQARFTDIHPRLLLPVENGDSYMKERKPVDITELYDLFKERKECYFVCCDIKSLGPINEISRKAGDLAILEVIRRMEKAAGEEDLVFRIGGDEFVLLTDHSDATYARDVADRISIQNGETIIYEGTEIPLRVHTAITRFGGDNLKYDELFVSLHHSLKDCKIYD